MTANRAQSAAVPLHAHQPWTVRVGTGLDDDEWDRFVASSPHGYHEQTSLWSQVKALYGWKPLRITLRDDERIVAGVQILIRTVRGGYRVGYASRGPVVRSCDPQLISQLVEEMGRAAEEEKVTYLAIAPPYDGHALAAELGARGFRRKPEPLPPGSVMTATLLIDLSHDLDRIQAHMRMQVRQHIRLAQRKGIVVREGSREDVEIFRALMISVCNRRGISPTPPEKDLFENLWQVFAPRGWGPGSSCRSRRAAGSAALFVVSFGDTARVWKAGWSGEFADRRPNNLVYWEAIRWAKQNGFRYFDMVGIDRKLGEQLLTGAAIDWTRVTGPCNFKVGYGGTPVIMPETCCRFLSPWPRLLLGMGGHRLLENPRLAHLLERLSA